MIVRPVDVRAGDVMLVPGDLHFDCQDSGAIELMLLVANAFRVNTITLVGDTFESAGISRHGRPARRFRFGRATIKAESKAAAPVLEAMDVMVSVWRGQRPGGLHVLTGNHERWWDGLQDDYPGLLDTPWYEVYGDTLDGWHVYAEHTALKFGPLLVCHGHRLRGALAARSASTVLANYPGQNTLYGHTHRIDTCITPTYKYGLPVSHGAWTVGHMKRMDVELTDPLLGPHAERHRQGFALVFFHDVGTRPEEVPEIRFHVEVVPIERTPGGRPYAIVGGVLFET